MRNVVFLIVGAVLVLLAACVPPPRSLPNGLDTDADPIACAGLQPDDQRATCRAAIVAIETAVADAMQTRYAQFDAPGLVSTAVDRVTLADGWALADFAYEIATDSDIYPDAAPTEWWRARFALQRDQAGDWQVVNFADIPDDAQLALWGPQQTLESALVRVTYHAFDEPYVRSAVADGLDSYAAQVADDLGVPLASQPPLEIHLAPRNTTLWQEAPQPRLWTLDSDIPSPGSTVEDAGSYLRLGLAEYLASQLLARSVGEEILATQPWPRLAFEIVLWEMRQVDRNDWRDQLVQGIHDPAEQRMALGQLFDPGWFGNQSPGSFYWRQAAVTFVAETYGRQSLGPLARALFTEGSWQDVVRTAFAEEPERIEDRWQAWLDSLIAAESSGSVARVIDFSQGF